MQPTELINNIGMEQWSNGIISTNHHLKQLMQNCIILENLIEKCNKRKFHLFLISGTTNTDPKPYAYGQIE